MRIRVRVRARARVRARLGLMALVDLLSQGMPLLTT